MSEKTGADQRHTTLETTRNCDLCGHRVMTNVLVELVGERLGGGPSHTIFVCGSCAAAVEAEIQSQSPDACK